MLRALSADKAFCGLPSRSGMDVDLEGWFNFLSTQPSMLGVPGGDPQVYVLFPDNNPSRGRRPSDQNVVRGSPVRRVKVTPHCVRGPMPAALAWAFL